MMALLERASAFGMAALAVALGLQWILVNRVPARWRVWIWRAALLHTVLTLAPLTPISLAVLAPATRAAEVESAPVIAAPAMPISPIDSQAPTIIEAPIVAAPEVQAPVIETRKVASAPPVAPAIRWSWREVFTAIYLLGLGVQLLLLARGAVRVRRVLANSTPVESAQLPAIAARLRIRKIPRVRQSASGAPFLTGVWRPTIVLPHGLDEAHIEAVLAHELAHLKRRDLAWNALLWLAQTLLWFHPLSFVARRFHALEVESACDELTLQLTQIAPKTYGALLIQSMNKHNSPLTADVSDGFFALKTRLRRLGRAPQNPRKRTRVLFTAALIISFAAVVPLRLVSRAQRAGCRSEVTKGWHFSQFVDGAAARRARSLWDDDR